MFVTLNQMGSKNRSGKISGKYDQTCKFAYILNIQSSGIPSSLSAYQSNRVGELNTQMRGKELFFIKIKRYKIQGLIRFWCIIYSRQVGLNELGLSEDVLLDLWTSGFNLITYSIKFLNKVEANNVLSPLWPNLLHAYMERESDLSLLLWNKACPFFVQRIAIIFLI